MPQKKPPKEIRQDFNKEPTYLYSVSVRPARSRKKDFTAQVSAMTVKLQELATTHGLGANVTFQHDEALARAGVFFMQATEKFALFASKTEGVEALQKTAGAAKPAPASRKSGKPKI